MSVSATFQNGNREITVTASAGSRWEKDGMVRDYIELSSSDKREPISKLYEVISGGTKDATVEKAGRTFGFQLGICCDSKTKRRAAVDAVEALVEGLLI